MARLAQRGLANVPVGTAALIALAVAAALGLGSPRSNRAGFQQTEPRCNPLRQRERRRAVRQVCAKGVTTDIATDFSRYRDVDAIGNSVTASMSRPDLDARKVAKGA